MGTLQWQWPWAVAIAAAATVLAVGAIVWIDAFRERRRQARRAHDASPARPGIDVWSLDDDLAGEEASRAWRTWRALGRAGTALVTVMVVVSIVLMGRPSVVDAGAERSASRDIVLCLDVSGSTLPYDREVIATYLDLVGRFRGERIGLSIFNSTSRTVFPLTDDYDLVRSQLSEANDLLRGVQSQDDIDAMSDADYQKVSDWLSGTQNRRQSTSLIGDGLVGCAAMLPGFAASGSVERAQAAGRDESIVLATDNVVSGTPTYTLAAALDLTSAAGISVDGLFSGPAQSATDAAATEMRSLVESHGGVFLTQRSGESVDALVRRIESRRAGESERDDRSSLVDAPAWPTLALCLLFAAYLITVWRLRR